MSRRPREQRGVVLAMVLIVGLLLTTTVVTFVRRALIDTTIAHNYEHTARAEALARGGIRIATSLLLEDLIEESGQGAGGDTIPGDTLYDRWARAGQTDIVTPDGDVLTLEIRDGGGRLNLNSLVDHSGETETSEEAVEFLADFLDKVIEESLPPGERVYDDSRDLAENLLDFLDPDETALGGENENDYYSRQDPPYAAANRPMLSIEELGLVEGFDTKLTKALRPYVTVYPLLGGSGINLNTAPTHVLAAVYHGTSGSRRLASEDTVRRILRVREEGDFLCSGSGGDDRCTPVAEVVDGDMFPPVELPSRSTAFTVVSRARAGDVERVIEAVVDRSRPTEPRLLSWVVR